MRSPALLNQIQDDAALGAASRQSRSKDLLDSIMDAIRNTPQKRREYLCHGDYHTDYEAIRAKIDALLSNAPTEHPTPEV